MVQNIIVGIIVVACIIWLGRSVYRQVKGADEGSGCGCSCTGCGPDEHATCTHEDTEEK